MPNYWGLKIAAPAGPAPKSLWPPPAIIVAAMTTELPECLATALSEHGEQLLEELRLLGAMPQVRLTDACVFDRGNGRVANKRGVICVLRCCGGQLDQKCNGVAGANACPTFVEAARLLRDKVQCRHGTPQCLAKAREALAEQAASSTAPPEDALAALMGASVARQRVGSALRQAEEQLRLLRAREAALAQERQAEELALADVQREAEQLGLVGANRQKTTAADRPPDSREVLAIRP